MNEENQIDLATALAEAMASDGHEVTYMDLLDYLAVLGIKLTRDEDGDASTAYLLEIIESAESLE